MNYPNYYSIGITPGIPSMRAFAQSRGYSIVFCRWLLGEYQMTLSPVEIGFPVLDYRGCVNRHECNEIVGDSAGYPDEATRPWILGNQQAKEVWAFECMLDAFAVMDRVKWHINHNNIRNRVAVAVVPNTVAAKAIGDLFGQESIQILAFTRNHVQGRLWMSDLLRHAGNPVTQVNIPHEFVGANDWTKSRRGAFDINLAVRSAQFKANG
jgi:hypothetical protein